MIRFRTLIRRTLRILDFQLELHFWRRWLPSNWAWLYTVNGGTIEYSMASGTNPPDDVQPVAFTYPDGTAPKDYLWILRAYDGAMWNESTLLVRVLPQPVTNQPPDAVDDAYSVSEDTTLTVPNSIDLGVLANDTDGVGDSLTAVLVTSPSNGSLTLNSDGSFMYTPSADFNGTDSFTYIANDGTEDSQNIATVTITVNAVNDDPFVANPLSPVTVDEDAVNTVLDLSTLFDDADGDILTLSIVSNSNPSLVAETLSGTGLTLDYWPNQSGTADIMIQAQDPVGSTAVHMLQVTVNPVNVAALSLTGLQQGGGK